MPTLGAAANNAHGMLAPAEATAGGYPLGLDKLAQRLDSVERLIRAQDEKLRRYFDRPSSHDGKLSR